MIKFYPTSCYLIVLSVAEDIVPIIFSKLSIFLTTYSSYFSIEIISLRTFSSVILWERFITIISFFFCYLDTYNLSICVFISKIGRLTLTGKDLSYAILI